MPFNTKAIIVAILIFITVPFGLKWYYNKTHPRYVPLPPREEKTITIIPGWNLRQVADYLVKENVASTTEVVYAVVGRPAFNYKAFKKEAPDLALDLPVLRDKPDSVSYEGYLAPETYRIYKDTNLADVIKKLVAQRDTQFTGTMYADIKSSGRSLHEVLTMASILEEEVKDDADRAKVADILWRRLQKDWALQVDSSVHYAIDKTGNVFTTQKERQVDSLWNTYKFPGLPPSPICNPGLPSIMAAIYPEKNEYWYFLSGKDGKMYFAKTLEEHNRNKKYL